MAKLKAKKVKKVKDLYTKEQRATFVIQPEDAVNPDAPVYQIARDKNK